MLSFEIVEALTNDVEFIDLASDWIEDVKFEKGGIVGKGNETEPLVSNSSRWLRR